MLWGRLMGVVDVTWNSLKTFRDDDALRATLTLVILFEHTRAIDSRSADTGAGNYDF